jgi:nucleoside-diphosphate-sugar epimerase
VVNGDLLDFDAADPLFDDVDACFFCAGMSSSGVSEKCIDASLTT